MIHSKRLTEYLAARLWKRFNCNHEDTIKNIIYPTLYQWWFLTKNHTAWYQCYSVSAEMFVVGLHVIWEVLLHVEFRVKREVRSAAYSVLNWVVFCVLVLHYNDVIMSAIASQITSLAIVYSSVYWDADQRKYQSSASLAFVRGIHRWPVNSPHKGPVTRKMFQFDDVIMPVLTKHRISHKLMWFETGVNFDNKTIQQPHILKKK